jgi:hypothetical protein
VITPLVLPAAIAVTAPPRQPLFDPVFASALPTALETGRQSRAPGLMLAKDGTCRQIALEGTESWCFNQHSSTSFCACVAAGKRAKQAKQARL